MCSSASPPARRTDAPEISVRLAQPDDAEFVLGLAGRFGATRAAWRDYDEVVSGTRRQLGDAFIARRDSDAIFIAVDAGGAPAGFSYVVSERDFFTGEIHAHVSEIAVSADGNGAGSALMQAAEVWSRDRGHRYISLNVNDTNVAARHFYERRAYVPEYRHLVKLL